MKLQLNRTKFSEVGTEGKLIAKNFVIRLNRSQDLLVKKFQIRLVFLQGRILLSWGILVGMEEQCLL